MPQHTSQLFGTNVVHLLALLTPGKDGELVLDLDDPVQRGMTVTTGGDVTWPPPPVAVSAAPAPVATAPVETPEELRGEEGRRAVAAAAPVAPQRRARRARCRPHGARADRGARVVPQPRDRVRARGGRRVLRHLQRQPLAAHPAHGDAPTPSAASSWSARCCRSGTRAGWSAPLAFVAATVAAINIFGGFLVAFRMIHMFRKEA